MSDMKYFVFENYIVEKIDEIKKEKQVIDFIKDNINNS